jgi:hypothetical protein
VSSSSSRTGNTETTATALVAWRRHAVPANRGATGSNTRRRHLHSPEADGDVRAKYGRGRARKEGGCQLAVRIGGSAPWASTEQPSVSVCVRLAKCVLILVPIVPVLFQKSCRAQMLSVHLSQAFRDMLASTRAFFFFLQILAQGHCPICCPSPEAGLLAGMGPGGRNRLPAGVVLAFVPFCFWLGGVFVSWLFWAFEAACISVCVFYLCISMHVFSCMYFSPCAPIYAFPCMHLHGCISMHVFPCIHFHVCISRCVFLGVYF